MAMMGLWWEFVSSITPDISTESMSFVRMLSMHDCCFSDMEWVVREISGKKPDARIVSSNLELI